MFNAVRTTKRPTEHEQDLTPVVPAHVVGCAGLSLLCRRRPPYQPPELLLLPWDLPLPPFPPLPAFPFPDSLLVVSG